MPTVKSILDMMRENYTEENCLRARDMVLQLTLAEIQAEPDLSSILLFKCAISGDFWFPAFRYLLEKVVNINHLYGQRQRTLLLAVCEQQPFNSALIETIVTAATQPSVDINAPYLFILPNGAIALRSPLFFAVVNKSPNIVKLMLDRGARIRFDEYNFIYKIHQPDAVFDYYVCGSIIAVAALLGDIDTLTVLLQHQRLSPILKDRLLNQIILPASGKTLLMMLAEHASDKNPEILMLILQYGADRTIKCKSSKTALDYALLAQNTIAVEALKPAEPKKQTSLFCMPKLKRKGVT